MLNNLISVGCFGGFLFVYLFFKKCCLVILKLVPRNTPNMLICHLSYVSVLLCLK